MYPNIFQQDPTKIIIKDVVSLNIKAAHVFEKYGIDFCCGGNKPLKIACEEKNVNIKTVLTELENLASGGSENKYDNWEPGFLINYIVNNHHSFVRQTIPQMLLHLDKVEDKHGTKHPELKEIHSLFKRVAKEMYSHMDKEEKILFHLIKYLVDCKNLNDKPKTGGYGSIKNPIIAMESEHSNAGGAMERIKELTNNYAPPADACNTFKLTYKELEDFEKDLHLHVHLENNILFPKAIQLEDELLNKH